MSGSVRLLPLGSPRGVAGASRAKPSIQLTFVAALDHDVATALRAAGFRFNNVLQHWEWART